jgi:hypothetical protein
MAFYVCDFMVNGNAQYPTLTDALACADAWLEVYRGESGDGWSEINISIFEADNETDDPEEDGKMVASADECNREYPPDDLDEDNYSRSSGEWWNPDFQYTCDYRMVIK